MANVLSTITNGKIYIIVVDSDPSIAPGASAPIGSFCLLSDGTGFYQKTSVSNTGWIYSTNFPNSIVQKTADYTLTSNDYTVECTSNSFTITLPTAVGIAGKIYNIKNSGTGTITLNTTSSQTIDGNNSGILMLVQRDNITVQSNNSNWIIL